MREIARELTSEDEPIDEALFVRQLVWVAERQACLLHPKTRQQKELRVAMAETLLRRAIAALREGR